jgi:hypothetical protein
MEYDYSVPLNDDESFETGTSKSNPILINSNSDTIKNRVKFLSDCTLTKREQNEPLISTNIKSTDDQTQNRFIVSDSIDHYSNVRNNDVIDNEDSKDVIIEKNKLHTRNKTKNEENSTV